MKQPLLLAAGVFAASIAFIGPARAGIVVIGSSDAAICSRPATQGVAAPGGLRACDEALRADDLARRDRAATLVNRGILRLRARSFERAIEDFDRALGLDPSLGEALVNRGAARVGQKRYREALADLDRGVALGSSEPEKAWFNRGLAAEGLGDLTAAYRAYQRAAELKPEWEAPRRELARFTVRPRS